MTNKKQPPTILKKVEDNYLVLTFGYGHQYILPYEDGITIINAFKNAEIIKKVYQKPSKIFSISDEEHMNCTILSREDYIKAKLAHLLKLEESDETS